MGVPRNLENKCQVRTLGFLFIGKGGFGRNLRASQELFQGSDVYLLNRGCAACHPNHSVMCPE